MNSKARPRVFIFQNVIDFKYCQEVAAGLFADRTWATDHNIVNVERSFSANGVNFL